MKQEAETDTDRILMHLNVALKGFTTKGAKDLRNRPSIKAPPHCISDLVTEICTDVTSQKQCFGLTGTVNKVRNGLLQRDFC